MNNEQSDAGSVREYSHRQRDELLDSIDSKVLLWFIEPMPPTMFVEEYWIGLISGLVVGALYGGIALV